MVGPATKAGDNYASIMLKVDIDAEKLGQYKIQIQHKIYFKNSKSVQMEQFNPFHIC